ncbi:unnamed protein product [Phaeothamnion confervicola]
MHENWTETLRCPRCNRRGAVSLTQPSEDFIPTVTTISIEFDACETDFGPTFLCKACRIEAVP